jgi:hypothetical protein
MVALKRGEEFSLDPREDAGQIFDLISSLRAVVIDPEFLPEKGKYLCHAGFSYQSNGVTKQALPQEIITLSREEACRLMSSGHCRPVDLNAWTPRELLNPKIAPTGTPKKMFDEVEVPKQPNWATAGVLKK